VKLDAEGVGSCAHEATAVAILMQDTLEPIKVDKPEPEPDHAQGVRDAVKRYADKKPARKSYKRKPRKKGGARK
jgi:hypothetical protein